MSLEVHHKAGITNWQKIYEFIRAELLTEPEELEVLCTECHKKEHE